MNTDTQSRKATAEGGRFEGTLMVRGRGIGFISLPDFPDDIIISKENLGESLDGDTVEVAIGGKNKEGRQTGSIVRVITRARNEYIGTIVQDGDRTYVKSDNRRIHVRFLLKATSPQAISQKAVVKIKEWRSGEEPVGEIVELLGRAGDHETEMQAIIRGGGFAVDFPSDVTQRAKEIYENQARIFSDAEKDPKRRDMRSASTCTIDPADAKDFDDALSIQTLDDGTYEIGIHIADVSHYVRENDAIDKEAQERGTSIYLVDRVIPMLPEVLSNDLCSLRPDEDRLAFSTVLTMNAEGTVLKRWFGQTIIHSDKRFSYEEAQEVLDTGAGPLLAELITCMTLSRKLRSERFKRGAIAFESEEVKFELDENKKPIRVYVKQRTETMLMIEDFMLLANREVSEHIFKLSQERKHELLFVYRIHDVPNPDKIEGLSIFLKALGFEFRSKNGAIEGKDINAMLDAIKHSPQANLIRTATIRSMAKAIYTTKNIGHFGLAFKYYTHFTSPIRRYPDLMVHRLLRKHLDNTSVSSHEHAHYEKLAKQSSEREVGAVEAERDSIKFKQVEYMKERVGQTFEGIITGVTDWGIYVEEVTSKAEGMVRLASMKEDYYTLDAKQYRIRGERKNKTYALGDKVTIKLMGVSLEDRTIDFVLV